MIKEAIGVGASLDEAKEDAIAQLNAREDDDIQYEVLEQPRKKTLGLFGTTQAKVRVFIEIPDEKPIAQKQEKPAEKRESTQRANTERAPRANNSRAFEERKIRRENHEKRAPDSEDWPTPVSYDKLEPDSKAARACNYLKQLLDGMGCTDVEMEASVQENGARVTLSGEGLGVAIGHRGETLDALQHLASLSANAGKGGYFRISLNIGNYREKREQALSGLARRTASQVKSTGRSRSLEPMNPYERRIIHTAIQEIKGVTSASTGEGMSRRVVISIEKGGVMPNNKPDAASKARPSAMLAEKPADAPKRDADVPLYGKIN